MPEENPFDKCGGYMNVKISKLENQVAKSSNIFKQSNLFDGISIFVNGWTNPTADDLKRIMMTYGGTYHHYERKHTTFIVAENLPDVKIRNMNTSNIISPKWVVDCVKANKILDYSKYLLYTNQKRSQPTLSFKNSYSDCIVDSYSNLNNTKSNESSLKRKIVSNQNENHLKIKKVDSNNGIDIDSSNNKDEKVSNIKEEDNKMHDASFAIEILNNKLANSELKIEKDKSINTGEDLQTTVNASKIAKTANDPKFLSEFYNNSRLHHIATLGAGFKQYVTELREGSSGDFPARKNLLRNLKTRDDFTSTPLVMHIDMDCFFVSVGLKKNPHLKGYPVAVTHSKGGAEVADRPGVDREQELNLYMKRLENRLQDNVMSDKKEKIKNGFDGKESLSEIASCSYEARKKGLKNGMFVGQALKLCPDLKTIPYDFEGYKEVAFQLYDTIAQYTLDIEAVSCDEMFVDLTSLLDDVKVDVMDLITYIRDEVKNKTQCPCSAGVGSNRLQARMATKKAKPDGQFYLDPDTILEYMTNIPIKDLPGVGYSTDCALKQLDWKTCGDLQNVSLTRLQSEFGKKFGETLYQACRGIDNKPLVFGQIRKSVSAEVNYGIRFTENTELEKFLKQLCEEVHTRLINIKRKGKCITLKVMIRAKDAPVETAKYMGHGFCDSMNKSVSLSDYTCDLETIIRTVLATMKALNIPPKELRGIGIQISKLNDINDIKKTNTLKNMFNKVVEKQKEKQITESKLKNDSKQCLNNMFATSEKITVENEALPPKHETNISIHKTPEKLQKKVTQKERKTPEKITNLKGRGRGKPKTNVNVKPSATILSMFQNVATKQNKPATPIKKAYEANEIDPNIFAELPEELQREILKENQLSMDKFSPIKDTITDTITEKLNEKIQESNEKNSVDKKIEVDIEFLNALPENLRLEIEKEIAGSKNTYLIVNKNNCNNIAKIEPNQNDLSEAGPSYKT